MSQKKKEAAREFSAEFKLSAVQRALAGERIAAIADELGIRRKLIYAWKDRYAEHGEAGLAQPRGRPRKLGQPQPQHEPTTNRGELLAARQRIAELERKVGQQELELDFFEQVLRRVTAVRRPRTRSRLRRILDHVEKSPDKAAEHRTDVRAGRRQPRGILSALASLGSPSKPIPRCAIRCSKWRWSIASMAIGACRHELRRRGMEVNAKRVLRLMREDNLLCLRGRGFVPPTTDARHTWRNWPNLTRGLITQTINELWVADITYVRLNEEFVFVAVVLDAHSRRVIGWRLAGIWARTWRSKRCRWRWPSGVRSPA